MYRILDSGISSFEEELITKVWTQRVTSLSNWYDFMLRKLMLRISIF